MPCKTGEWGGIFPWGGVEFQSPGATTEKALSQVHTLPNWTIPQPFKHFGPTAHLYKFMSVCTCEERVHACGCIFARVPVCERECVCMYVVPSGWRGVGFEDSPLVLFLPVQRMLHCSCPMNHFY